MEAVAEASADLVTESQSLTKKRIQVSNAKKPLHFYVFLAKRYMRQHNEIEIELSALGMAIATAVTVAEILKRSGFAIQKKLVTSMVDRQDENTGHLIKKAKIEILLAKSENFDDLMIAATAAAAKAAKEASQNKHEQ